MSEYVCRVEVKRIYGNILYYPLNDAAKNFTILLNCKVLTKQQLRKIRNCGFEIDVIYKMGETIIDVPDNLKVDHD